MFNDVQKPTTPATTLPSTRDQTFLTNAPAQGAADGTTGASGLVAAAQIEATNIVSVLVTSTVCVLTSTLVVASTLVSVLVSVFVVVDVTDFVSVIVEGDG